MIKQSKSIPSIESFDFSNLVLRRSKTFEVFGISQLVAWSIVGLCMICDVLIFYKVRSVCFFPPKMFSMDGFVFGSLFCDLLPVRRTSYIIILRATLSGPIDGIEHYMIPKWDLVVKFNTKSSFSFSDQRIWDGSGRNTPEVTGTWLEYSNW